LKTASTLTVLGEEYR